MRRWRGGKREGEEEGKGEGEVQEGEEYRNREGLCLWGEESNC